MYDTPFGALEQDVIDRAHRAARAELRHRLGWAAGRRAARALPEHARIKRTTDGRYAVRWDDTIHVDGVDVRVHVSVPRPGFAGATSVTLLDARRGRCILRRHDWRVARVDPVRAAA